MYFGAARCSLFNRMQQIIIVGAGGHGREIADILSVSGACVIGFVDDDPALQGRIIDELPVLGEVSYLANGIEGDVIIGVGDPALAQALVNKVSRYGRTFASAVSRNAVVSPRAEIGDGTAIFPNAIVGPDCVIGDHCILNVGATVSHDSVLERHVVVNPGAHLAGSVRCGEGAFVGMGASIIQGKRIGAWAKIGAGAAVIHDIPPGVTAVGVPARVVRGR